MDRFEQPYDTAHLPACFKISDKITIIRYRIAIDSLQYKTGLYSNSWLVIPVKQFYIFKHHLVYCVQSRKPL